MLRLDVTTMETTPVVLPYQQRYPFDWIGSRHCNMSIETYQHLVDGDLVAYVLPMRNSFIKMDKQVETAHDLVLNLKCIRQRRAQNLAILASHLVGDGDHAIAYRVGQCLGRMERW